jgi:hypothetical protein
MYPTRGRTDRGQAVRLRAQIDPSPSSSGSKPPRPDSTEAGRGRNGSFGAIRSESGRWVARPKRQASTQSPRSPWRIQAGPPFARMAAEQPGPKPRYSAEIVPMCGKLATTVSTAPTLQPRRPPSKRRASCALEALPAVDTALPRRRYALFGYPAPRAGLVLSFVQNENRNT